MLYGHALDGISQVDYEWFLYELVTCKKYLRCSCSEIFLYWVYMVQVLHGYDIVLGRSSSCDIVLGSIDEVGK